MGTHTRAKPFRYERSLASVGVGEPSITLIENDVAFRVLVTPDHCATAGGSVKGVTYVAAK